MHDPANESASDDFSTRSLAHAMLGLQHAVGNRAVQRLVEEALRSPGEPLPENSRARMENVFGRDFSSVRLHTNPSAAAAAVALNSKAFTFGSDIVLNGCPDTDTYDGRQLLAHELTHVAQQELSLPGEFSDLGELNSVAESEASSLAAMAAAGKSVEPRVVTALIVAPDVASDNPKPEPEPSSLTAKLDAIAAQYRAIIDKGLKEGHPEAADNLQRFLDGTGGVKTFDVSWLRGFDAVTGAEKTNQQRFEASLSTLAKTVQHAMKKTFEDHWDRLIQASVFSELYYASGTSTLKSTGKFSLEGIENIVTIGGRVQHHWYDPYDWHEGLSAYIPGFGNISDADALLLQKYRGAKPFMMEAAWTQDLQGTYTHRDWWFDSADYFWTGP
jgi:Domain of unknown function (DUF4157)